LIETNRWISIGFEIDGSNDITRTIKMNFETSISQKFEGQSTRVKQLLSNFILSWSKRRTYSMDIMELMIQEMFNDINQIDFSQFDDVNFFGRLLLCDEPYADNKTDAKLNVERLNRIVDNLKSINQPPPPLPSVCDTTPKGIARDLKTSFKADLNKFLWIKYFKNQQKCIKKVLISDPVLYGLDEDQLKNKKYMKELVFQIVKRINGWKFRTESDSKFSNIMNENIKNLIFNFSIILFDNLNGEYGLTKTYLRKLKNSELLASLKLMIQTTKRLLNNQPFHLRVTHKPSNRMINLSFGYTSFRETFPLWFNSKESDFHDIFECASFRTNTYFTGHFRTNSETISFTIEKTKQINNQISIGKKVHEHFPIEPENSKACLRMSIILLLSMSEETKNQFNESNIRLLSILSLQTKAYVKNQISRVKREGHFEKSVSTVVELDDARIIDTFCWVSTFWKGQNIKTIEEHMRKSVIDLYFKSKSI
jgi:hypothetical protein